MDSYAGETAAVLGPWLTEGAALLASAMRGVSERTIQRLWEKARLYLHRAIGEVAPGEPR